MNNVLLQSQTAVTVNGEQQAEEIEKERKKVSFFLFEVGTLISLAARENLRHKKTLLVVAKEELLKNS